ncbi:MAG TPA: MarR family transcriptional regulator [Acidimicrobiales bacterium]
MRDRRSSVKGSSETAGVAGTHPVEALPDEATNVLFDVWLVSRATGGLLDAALAPSGLSADEFGIYSVLTSTDGMTPTELSRWMAAPPTTVSSAVRRIEQRGHLERIPNPEDRRSYRMQLTPAGRAAHLAAGAAFMPALRAVGAALGPTEPGVRQSLAELRTAIDHAAATLDVT